MNNFKFLYSICRCHNFVLLSYFMSSHWIYNWMTRRMTLVKEEPLSLLKHMSSVLVFRFALISISFYVSRFVCLFVLFLYTSLLSILLRFTDAILIITLIILKFFLIRWKTLIAFVHQNKLWINLINMDASCHNIVFWFYMHFLYYISG